MKKLTAAVLAALVLAGCSSSGSTGSNSWLEERKNDVVTTTASTTSASATKGEESSEEEKPVVKEPLSYASEYYLKNNADERIKNVAGVLLAGIKEESGEIDISDFELTEKEFEDIFGLMICCEPETCWIEYNYKLGKISGGNITKAYFTYRLSGEGKKAATEKLDAAVSELVSNTDGMSDFDRVLYFHDYLVEHCDYDKNNENAWSAYGCLIDGKAVCEGYSKAMLLLCDRAGIPCLPVSGTSGTESREMHMWNKVQMDGSWYNIDVTWDDPTDGNDTPITEETENTKHYDYIHRNYFGLTDAQTLTDHAFSETSYIKYPEAVSTEDNYFVHEGLLIQNAEQADEVFYSASVKTLESGGNIFQVSFPDGDAYDEVYTYEFEDCRIFDILERLYVEGFDINHMRYEYVVDEEHFLITLIILKSEPEEY